MEERSPPYSVPRKWSTPNPPGLWGPTNINPALQGPQEKPEIPNHATALWVGTPTAHWRFSILPSSSMRPWRPSSSVFWVVRGHKKSNIITVHHLWTFILFSRNVCRLLKVLSLREQPPFNKGLIMVLLFKHLFFARDYLHIVCNKWEPHHFPH